MTLSKWIEPPTAAQQRQAMRSFYFLILGAASTISLLTGCQTALRPSSRQRELSFSRLQPGITSQYADVSRSTYLVFASDQPLQITVTPEGEGAHLKAGGESTSGLAVALSKDGYLLSAAHVVRRFTYVVGYMNGHVDVSMARVLDRTSDGDFGAEYAILKIDQSPDRPCPLANGDRGEIAFAVACKRDKSLTMIFIAGRIRSAKVLSGGVVGSLITSDLPLWYGDSGGPLFTADGRLIGVNTAFKFGFRRGWIYYDRYSFAPDSTAVEREIEMDRAQHRG